jgi:hypothetical protein
VPCCRFAWRGTENFGKATEQPCVHTQHVTEDLTWGDDPVIHFPMT